MLANAAIAIDLLAAPVTRRRSGVGSYVNGLWVAGSVTTATIAACVYAISPKETMNLPEGIRTEAEVIAWSRAELRSAAGSTVADEIVWQGSTYRVLHVWDRVEGGFFKAALGRVAG